MTLLSQWTWPTRLRDKGIIGMNRRNIRYIGRYNNRRLYPLVDDKLKTKLLAQSYGVTSPALIGTVETQFGIKHLYDLLKGSEGFVIKPAKGIIGMNRRNIRYIGRIIAITG